MDYIVASQYDADLLAKRLAAMNRPYSVSITQGKKRSIAQNKLQRLLCNEISEQLGDTTPEEVRALCKLQHGVPIMRHENEKFCQAYDKHVKPLPMETKLACMAEPLDFPVTRLMTTKQKTQYLDAIYRHYSAQGLRLTSPEDQGL